MRLQRETVMRGQSYPPEGEGAIEAPLEFWQEPRVGRPGGQRTAPCHAIPRPRMQGHLGTAPPEEFASGGLLL